jgi:hypothetical protein
MCLGNAKKHSSNDEWYCTMVAMISGVMSMMLVLSVMVMYLCYIDVTATCDSCVLAWHLDSSPTVSNRKRPKVSGACWTHVPHSHCHRVLPLQSRYPRCCCFLCCIYHFPSCFVRMPSHDSTSSTACFHAFHDVGLCLTGHYHLLFRFCVCPWFTQSSMLCLLWSTMSDRNNTCKSSRHLFISCSSRMVDIPGAVIRSIIAISPSLPGYGVQSPLIWILVAYSWRCDHISFFHFLSMIFSRYHL